jgi:hypothetical protein
VIATGSDNSARYFHQYFGKYPHIIRKNRNSIAVLDGTETKADLLALGKDIFNYSKIAMKKCSHAERRILIELNKLTALNNAIYWLEKYIENHNDAKICKIKNSLEISVDTINDAFIELSNIIAECH